MRLDEAARWIREHYTLPVAAALLLTSVLAPVSSPVIAALLIGGATLVVIDVLRGIGRSFRDGYRGRD